MVINHAAMNKLLTIPKEKHIHRMKNGVLHKMPLSEEEILRLIKYCELNLEGEDALKSLNKLLCEVERIHGVV